MTKLNWRGYPIRALTKVSSNVYVMRVAAVVSDVTPFVETTFSDSLITLNCHYNKRGYCVGYSLVFKGKPKLLLNDFYVVLDYLPKGGSPKGVEFPALEGKGKLDPAVCLVKFGNQRLANRLYTFIYRRKRE